MTRTRPAVRAAALVATLCGVMAPAAAHAHAIHTTHTTVTADANGYTLTVRAFADDLSASVARFHKRLPPADSSVRVNEVLAYAASRMAISASGRSALPLRSCGIRRVGDAYVLCFRIATTPRTVALTFGNQMLAELHADQVNIVQCDVAGSRRTNLFTRGRAPKSIVERGVCAAS